MLIHGTLVSMDDNAHAYDIYEHIHIVLLIDKEQKSLYKDSKTSLIISLLFIVDLKVMNSIQTRE